MNRFQFLKFLVVPIFCVVLTLPSGPSLAQVDPVTESVSPREIADTNPHPKGTAKRVLGNVLIPVSAVVGGLLLASGLMRSSCDKSSQAYSASNCRSQKNQEALGAMIAVAGISAGIYLKIDGNADRKVWNQWNEEHRSRDDDAARTYEVGYKIVFN